MFNKDYAWLYDRLNKNKKYDQEIDFVYNWAGKPINCLDLGCGTAKYWKYFPKEVNITGLEVSPDMRKQSRYTDKIALGDISTIGQNQALKALGLKIWGKPTCDTVFALYDVLNYMPNLNWIKDIPVKKGGYLIFDIWDSVKAKTDGFKTTMRFDGDLSRTITPVVVGKTVVLEIETEYQSKSSVETHMLYLHTEAELMAIKGFEIVDKKETKNWQTWYKMKKL